MSNVYKSMGRIVDYAIAYLNIVPDTAASDEDVAAVCKMLDAWSALAPDWSNAPDDARWYTIDVEGDCAWHDEEPMLHGGRWYSPHKYTVNDIDLPDHIDWRDCKWQRPEVAA